MRNTTCTLLIIIGVFRFSAQTPNPLVDFSIRFPENKVELTQKIIDQVDSVYDMLLNGYQANIYVVDKQERKDHKYVMRFSRPRCEVIKTYLLKKLIPHNRINLGINPFDTKGGPAGSNADYRRITNRTGEYYLNIEKPGTEKIPYTLPDSGTITLKPCQKFSIDPNENQTIFGAEGTVVAFQKKSFVYQNGLPVLCNSIEICLEEYFKKSEMVSAGLYTVSPEGLLISAGMVCITAKCNGLPVKLKSSSSYYLALPLLGEKKINNMNLFDDRRSVNWKEAKNASQVNPPEEIESDSEISESFWGSGLPPKDEAYIFKVSKLGFINCDMFFDIKDKSDLYVKSDTSYNYSVSLVFTDTKSMLPGYTYSADKKVKFKGVPKGKKASIIVIGKKNDTYAWGLQEIIIGEERKIDVPLNPVTLDMIKQNMKKFN